MKDYKLDNQEFKNQYTITKRIDSLLWECHGKSDFSKLNDIIKKFNPDKMSCGHILSLISTVKWGEKDLDYYPEFFHKCKESLKKRGLIVDGLLTGLEPK